MKAARHGTNSKYHTGCRCDDCTEAHRDYAREYWRTRSRERKSTRGAGRPITKFDVSSEPRASVDRMVSLAFKRFA